MIEQKIIINVGRQLGSGGHDIGRMLALDFQAKYYDRELLNLAAKESGFSEKFFEQNDEKKGFFKGLFNVQTSHFTGGSMYKTNFSQESLFQFQSDAIVRAAKEGSCVFVGRCADYILRDYPNVVSVFIHAPEDYCRIQAIERGSQNPRDVDRFIQKTDKRRADYYRFYTGHIWNDARNYDLCLNSERLGFEGCVRAIRDYIRIRFEEKPED